MRRGVSVRAYGGADEETRCDTVGEGTGVFSKKRTERREKKGRFVRKSTSFYSISPYPQKSKHFFSQNPRSFETKSLLLRLIKHNFPFIPPHCGVHIAQSRGTFPDHPAQTLFDLLNLRDFVLSLHLSEHPKRRCPSAWGRICTTATLPFFNLYEKEEEQRNVFSTRKGAVAFFGQRGFGYSHSSLVLPPCGECSCVWSVVRCAPGSLSTRVGIVRGAT